MGKGAGVGQMASKSREVQRDAGKVFEEEAATMMTHLEGDAKRIIKFCQRP